MQSERRRLKKIKREKDYRKKRNIVRNNIPMFLVRGRRLIAGIFVLPKSKKFNKSKKSHDETTPSEHDNTGGNKD